MVGLLNKSSQSAAGECFGVGGLPESGDRSSASLHGGLEALVLDALDEVVREERLQRAVDHGHARKAKLKHDVFVVLDEVLNCEEDSVEGVVDYVLSEEAGCCNGHWVAVDHAEALLED